MVRCGTSQCDIVSVVHCGIVGAVRWCGKVVTGIQERNVQQVTKM